MNGVSTYTSAAQLERERALLFGRQPLLVGLSSDLADPGAYLVHGDSGIPILVVRSAVARAACVSRPLPASRRAGGHGLRNLLRPVHLPVPRLDVR